MAVLACVAYARPKSKNCTIALSSISASATGGTGTIENVYGYLDEVQVVVTDGASTGTVVVSYQPADSTAAAVNIATNSVSDEQLWRPRVDGTDVAAAALTGDPPSRRMLYGETISFVVSGSPTNKTWRCRVKYDDGR